MTAHCAIRILRIAVVAILAAAGATACGGGYSTPMALPRTYAIGGTVRGLTGTGLVLRNNGGDLADDISVSGAGAFTFAARLPSGAGYHVEARAMPSSPAQNCEVINGSGTVATANVTTITVVCRDVGHVVYGANAGDNTVSVYAVDPATSALTAVGMPVATGTSPDAIAASPDGLHVYVGNETSNDISVYAVDAGSGALTPIADSPFAAGTGPRALAFDPSGIHLYVVNNGSNNLSAFSVNVSTGALTPLTTATYATGTGPSAVSVDSSGSFVFVANNGGSNNISVFAISAGSGALTPVAGSPFAAGDNPHSLALAATSGDPWDYAGALFLYTANFSGITSTISAFGVDTNTGVLTAIGGSPFAVAVDHGIAVDRDGSYLYVTTGRNIVGYRIDGGTGSLTALAGFPVTAGANAYSVTLDPSNRFLYVGNDGDGNLSGYTLDPATGGLAPIPGSPFEAGRRPDFIAIH
jgi:6-phosphogluconolactonase